MPLQDANPREKPPLTNQVLSSAGSRAARQGSASTKMQHRLEHTSARWPSTVPRGGNDRRTRSLAPWSFHPRGGEALSIAAAVVVGPAPTQTRPPPSSAFEVFNLCHKPPSSSHGVTRQGSSRSPGSRQRRRLRWERREQQATVTAEAARAIFFGCRTRR